VRIAAEADDLAKAYVLLWPTIKEPFSFLMDAD
jgi:hypothetical protein